MYRYNGETMEDNRTKNTSRSIIWGVFNKIVAIVLPFATRTVMIYYMGMEYVGLGSLFTSILQVLSFAELGIGSALVFSMYKPIAEQDTKKVCALLNYYRKAYRTIGIVILAIGIALMPFIKHLIAGDVPGDINIYILYTIYLLNNVIGYFLFAYKQSLFTALQRVDILSKIGMLLQLLMGTVQILVLVVFQNYYLFVFAIPITTCINNILIGILTDKKYPQYKCIGDIDIRELQSIKKKVGGMVFQRIGGIVLSSVDTIVISAFLGLLQLALYQNYYYIFTAINGFFAVIQQAMIPSVGNSVVIDNVNKNYLDFKKFNFLYVWVVAWFSACLMCLYQPFMEIWVGKDNIFDLNMVILFVVYFFIYKWCDMLYIYQDACGLWWQTRYVPFLSSMLNLFVNIILVIKLGLPGILISTIVAIALVYDIGYAKVIFRTYFKSITGGLGKYWKRQFLYLSSTIFVVFITWEICNWISIENLWLRFIINGCICVCIPNVALILLWYRLPEFKEAVNMLKRIRRK